MNVTLRGSSASSVTAGILLLTQARRLGHPIQVQVEGDASDIAAVEGPCMVYSPVLGGCGVGRKLGSGPLVIVPGPPSAPLALSVVAGGTENWFTVDRSGVGEHASTRSFVALCRDRSNQARSLGRQLRRTLAMVGCTPEPALLDLLFGAPVSPLARIAMALRAGRAMTGNQGESLIRFTANVDGDLPDPLPSPCSIEAYRAARSDGRFEAYMGRLSLGIADSVEDWFLETEEMAEETEALLCGLAEVGSHLLALPSQGMLPPLDAAMDAVAVGLGPALGATRGVSCGNQALVEVFQFLGGRFVEAETYAYEVPGGPPPEGRLARWQWLCASVEQVEATADDLWRRVVDPVQ